MFWQHDYESVTWWERRASCDMETGTGIVTMWPWHGTQAGSQSRTSESLSGCVSGVPCHRWTSPRGSHMVTRGIRAWYNSHLSSFHSVEQGRAYLGHWRLFVIRRNVDLMAYGFWEGYNLTRFVYMCQSNMCYMFNVCVYMSDRITHVRPKPPQIQPRTDYYPHQGGKPGHKFT